MSVASMEVRWGEWVDDPYPLYRVLRDERPVYFDEPNGAHVLTRYEDVAEVLRDHRRFSSRPLAQVTGEKGHNSSLPQQDPPSHTAHRRVVTPLFTSGRMRRQAPYFRRVAADIVSALESGRDVEVSSEVAVPLAGRVTCDLLGVPFELQARFRALTKERQALLLADNGRIEPSATDRTIDDVRADLWDIVGPLAEERRAQPCDDAISVLVAANTAGADAISDLVLVDMLLLLFHGGFATTQHLVEMLIDHVVDRPALWDRLRADRSLIDLAIEEMLRWDAPVQALRRRAVEDEVIRDVPIRKDSMVFAVLGAANRDERVFTDPDRFDLGRDYTRHTAFGVGVHYCPGAPVSRVEVRALLDELFDRFGSIDRAGPSVRWPQVDDPKRTVEAMRGYECVPVRLHDASG
jgi:cytochrome P450